MEKNFENRRIEEIIDYHFGNPVFLRQAFVRRSYTEENGGENNEVLEFIGDKALDVAVVRFLTQVFGSVNYDEEDEFKRGTAHLAYNPRDQFYVKFLTGKDKEYPEYSCKLNEGELTKLKQRMVEKKTLAKRIDELGLAQYLIVSEGDEVKRISEEQSVKEDLFEAIIGAVAIDSNWDFGKIVHVVEIMLRPDTFLETQEIDYVGAIFEWAAKKGLTPEIYYSDDQTDLMIRSVYEEYSKSRGGVICKLVLDSNLPPFNGFGRSQHAARKDVCKFAYEYLMKKKMLFSVREEIENPNLEEAIGQLETLSRRGYFSIPEYEFEEEHDENGNPIWNVTCKIPEKKKIFSSKNSVKKMAKKQAALKMLKCVLKSR